MAEDGKVVYKVEADNSGLSNDLNQSESIIKKSTSGWGGVAKGAASAIGGAFVGMAAAGGAALVSFAQSGIEVASNLSEVQNVVDTVFGDSAKSINDWSQSALNAYGLSELSAKKFTSTMGAMLDSMGLSDATVADMSTSLAGLSGDMASFYNLDPQEAFDKLRAGISGETEPLKQLGINMSVANLEAFALSKGMTTTYDKMTQAEQATLRYQYIMDATANAQGDFSKTSDSLANQQRLLQEKLSAVSGQMGQILIPVMQQVIGSFSSLLDAGSPLVVTLTDVFTTIATAAAEILPQLIEALAAILPPILDLVTSLLPVVLDLFTTLAPILVMLAQEVFPPLVEIIAALLPPIAELIGALLPPLAELLKALAPLLTMVAKLLTPIIKLFSSLLTPVVELISSALTPLVEMISEIVDAVFPALSAALESIGSLFGSIFNGISETVIGTMAGLKESFGGLTDFITGVFTGNWSKAWEGVKKIFSGVFNSLGAIFKAPINFIIDGMNCFIRGLNKIKIPDWVPLVGGKGINIAEIPRLAKGGTLTSAGTVMVGENGPEMLSLPEGATVTPLSGYQSLAGAGNAPSISSQAFDASGIDDAVARALSGWGLYIDGKQAGKMLASGVSAEQAQSYYALQRSGFNGNV